jgi:opacity protein-like surface antigen
MSSHDLSCRKIAIAAALVAGTAIATLPSDACAADFGLPPLPAQIQPNSTQPVEFGTGWYIRGDTAFAMDSLPEINEFGIFPITSGLRNTYSLGGGGGYKFNNWFRTDIVFDWRDPLTASDSGTSTYAYGSRWDALANGYVDLGNWNGFAPYVGAGVGVAWGEAKFYTRDPTISPCTQGGTVTCFEKNTPMNLAWALMAGVAYEIFPHAFIDVGYRYLNLGNYSFYDNSILSQITVPAGMTASAPSHVQEVRFGLRYVID